MMLRVCLIALAGLCGAANAKHDPTRRLQVEHDQRRRLQVLFPLPTWNIDLDAMFTGTMNSVEDFFTEDMVDFFETAGHAYTALCVQLYYDGLPPINIDIDLNLEDAWNGMVGFLSDAADWTETAWDTVTTPIEEVFEHIGCIIEEDFEGDSCSKCVRQVCSGEEDHPDVHVTEEKLAEMSAANAIALMDMAQTYEPYIEGCASALESCPSMRDCESLEALPDSTKYLVAGNLAQCNLCWTCLPYGSTQEGCQQALEQVLPNNCEGCNEKQLGIYNAFYSCSSMQVIYESIESVGEFYQPESLGDLEGPGRTYMNGLCHYCYGCSNYDYEITNLCTDWKVIQAEWDCTAPEVPDVLNDLNHLLPTPTPTPGPTTTWWIGPPRRV